MNILQLTRAFTITIVFASAWFVLSLSLQAQQDKGVKNTSGVAVPKVPVFDQSDAAKFGLQIAKYADEREQGWKDEVSRGSMTLIDADGDSVKRTFSRRVLEKVKEGDKLLIAFLSPNEIKGVKALTFENPGSSDDNWLYLPSTKRVRRVSGANNTASFQGTEFTYEDLANIDYREYQWRFLKMDEIGRKGKKAQSVYKLYAKPTYSDTGYAHLHVYYNKVNFRQERVDYFDKAGKLLKTRDNRDWQLKHGRFWRSDVVEMINHQNKKKTHLRLDKYFVNLALYTSKKTGKPRRNLTDAAFTKRVLKK